MRKHTTLNAKIWNSKILNAKTCSGCGNPFVVRHGQSEAIVGPDGQLYCFGTDCQDEVFAPYVHELKHAPGLHP
jgi:hypothetical protein